MSEGSGGVPNIHDLSIIEFYLIFGIYLFITRDKKYSLSCIKMKAVYFNCLKDSYYVNQHISVAVKDSATERIRKI